MTYTRVAASRSAGALLFAILICGAVAGSLDIIAASIQTTVKGGEPIRMLQGIASAFLGKDSYERGLASAAIGLATHFGIATSMAAAFVLVASRVPALLRGPFFWGPLYGLLMWCLMNLVVLPLRWPQQFPRFDSVGTPVQICFHMFLVGLPIAIISSRLLRPERI